jgi:ABC-type multidrug transport system fused ATPase/permease subunit
VEAEPVILSGTVRGLLGAGAPAASVVSALRAACAEDVIEGLPEGLDTELPERARTLSGGQRQRLVLAQALVADPEVLVLVEPTSAVDAHTESLIASRLGVARAGRTTVVFSTSPLVLERADKVVLLSDGAVVSGTHRELLAGDADYRALVTRGLAS